jgi:hypothetical protein
VVYLLKARTMEAEKQPLLGNARSNNRGIFTICDVTPSAFAIKQLSIHARNSVCVVFSK